MCPRAYGAIRCSSVSCESSRRGPRRADTKVYAGDVSTRKNAAKTRRWALNLLSKWHNHNNLSGYGGLKRFRRLQHSRCDIIAVDVLGTAEFMHHISQISNPYNLGTR